MAKYYAWNYNGLENMTIFVVDDRAPKNPKNSYNGVSTKTDSLGDTYR